MDDDISYGGDDDDNLSEGLSVDEEYVDPFTDAPKPPKNLGSFGNTTTSPASPNTANKSEITHRPEPKYSSASGGNAGGTVSISDLRKLGSKTVRKNPTRDAIHFPTPPLPKPTLVSIDSERQLTAEEIYGKANVGIGPGIPSTGYSSTDPKRQPRRFGSGDGSLSAISGTKSIGSKLFRREKFNRSSNESRTKRSFEAPSSEDKELALANFAAAAENDISAAANIVRHGTTTINPRRLFKRGENVLVASSPFSHGYGIDQQVTSRPVNKFGFPKGMGKTEQERKGQYVYVLAEVLEVKFDENSPYYLVKRYDTGNTQRADGGE